MIAQGGKLFDLGWVGVCERARAQLAVRRGQEHHAIVRQAGHHKLDDLIEKFVLVTSGGDQRSSVHQEVEALLGAVGLGPGIALALEQFDMLRLGALACGLIDGEGNPP
jgi:hypothetical protein